MKRVSVALCLAFCCAAALAQAAPRSTIRVGLWTLWRDREATITPVSSASVRLCETCAASPLAAIAVRAEDAHLHWTEQNGRAHSSAVMLLAGAYRIAAHGESLTISYPLRITAHAGALVLVATLPVERYVELVVAAESGSADSPESRKALAIVARSFALVPTHGHTAFDVCDSTHCQWVHWRSTPQAHAATLATAGESLWYHGSRAEAYFHQNCGGRTAAASEVWPGSSASAHAARGPLVSRPDPYCLRAGSSQWSATLSRAELTQALAAAGLAAPGWKSLTVAERGESGRATWLLAGSTRIPAEDFRLAVGRALGWNRIRSNWFEVAAEGGSFLFHGRGSGHGVGLCQAGAAEMAREGHSYREILAQYFPGATLAEQTTGAAWQSLNGPGFILESSEAADAAWLPVLARALAEAKSRSGLTPRAPVTVRVYRSTPAFRDAALVPGWVAGPSAAAHSICKKAASGDTPPRVSARAGGGAGCRSNAALAARRAGGDLVTPRPVRRRAPGTRTQADSGVDQPKAGPWDERSGVGSRAPDCRLVRPPASRPLRPRSCAGVAELRRSAERVSCPPVRAA